MDTLPKNPKTTKKTKVQGRKLLLLETNKAQLLSLKDYSPKEDSFPPIFTKEVFETRMLIYCCKNSDNREDIFIGKFGQEGGAKFVKFPAAAARCAGRAIRLSVTG